MSEMTNRELDRFIAERVMVSKCPDGLPAKEGCHIVERRIFPYYTTTDAALTVLEKCAEKCGDVHFYAYDEAPKFKMWGGGYQGRADTLPLAICKFAFLLFGGGK